MIEKPIVASKKQTNILDELDAILAKENTKKESKQTKVTEGEKFVVKETKSSLFIKEKEVEKSNKKKFSLDESEEKTKKEIKYTKISLFDED